MFSPDLPATEKQLAGDSLPCNREIQSPNTNPVLKLIHSRRLTGSQPGRRSDGAKLALVIEGGGMRGVVTAGMVTALEQLGLRDAFDVVYGASGGAINAAYFLAGQATFGTSVYYQDINNRWFLNPFRFSRSLPILSLEFLLDHVCETQKPLDWDAVVASQPPLTIIASSTTKHRSVALRRFQDKAELREGLRASARVPFVAGPPVAFRGDYYLDAYLTEPIPFKTPFEYSEDNSCTHALVLLSRPKDAADLPETILDRWVFGPRLARAYPEWKEVHDNGVEIYRRDSEELIKLEHRALRSLSGPYVLSVSAAQESREIRPTETDRNKLIAGAAAGARAVVSALFNSHSQVVEVLRIYGRL